MESWKERWKSYFLFLELKEHEGLALGHILSVFAFFCDIFQSIHTSIISKYLPDTTRRRLDNEMDINQSAITA